MPKISTLRGPNISVQLSGDDLTSSSHIPVAEGVSREVVMLPATKDICGDGVEIVTAVLVKVLKKCGHIQPPTPHSKLRLRYDFFW